ncbi:MAG TPA: diadenylate cyclase CdaA, partial [Limnochordia bacterium]
MFTLVDAVDILIVAYLVFRLMLLLRGTRATAVLKGLGLLVVASVLSRYLGLRTVSWLLDRGTTVILVALPVVFYPELRRALEHLGRGQIFSRLSALADDEIERVIAAVARATRALSQARVGAIFVFERDIGLEEFIESGVRLDAAVSAELLLNLFSPTTPLHDGAVIVRGDRVAAAGCFLPLTENPHVTRNLGTRHRAALGISEQSDAVVVVVSEETGTIS